MKLFWASILIMLVAIQSFGKWLVLLDFNINQQYIAQNLCENRAKPQMKCGGKCQLAKKLAAEEQQQSDKNGTTSKAKFVEVLFSMPESFLPTLRSGDDAAIQNQYYLIAIPSITLTAPFHPPAIA